MSIDNRTQLNDCEDDSQTFATTGAQLGTSTLAGSFYEGAASVDVQHSNVFDDTYTTGDSTGSAFNIDMSDMTLYLMVKDNLVDTYANGGALLVIGDGTDRIGYYTGGNDAVGLIGLPIFFSTYKLDISVQVASPESNNAFAGSEVNLDQTAITQAGFGSLHTGKAAGAIVNLWIDGIYYIANDSYALTINGGTSGTPETMSDVQGDDVTNGWGMVGNPLGNQYTFFAPTEWGNVSTIAEHAFTADGEQWFWIGDNAGGHAVGATHFPFRLVSNATDTGSWIVSNTSIVNIGTRAQFLMDDANFNTVEIDGCSLTGLGAIELPSLGGTSRFTTNCIFSDCDRIDNNGADMTGSSVLLSNVVADEGALFYDENADPDGELDNLIFTQGTAAHHAIRFGANIPATITLRNCDFSGFSSSDDNDGSVFQFDDTAGSITFNLVNCTNDGSGFTVDERAGVDVTVVIDPVTTLVHVDDNAGDDLQSARVYLKAITGGPLPFEDSVTITRFGTVATVAHTTHGMVTNDKVKILGITDKIEDNNGVHQITFISAGSYSYTTTDSGSTSYTGSITSTWVALEGDTDVNGDISLSKTYGSNQPVNGQVRKSTASPRFKSFPISGIINSSTGLSISVRMILDE